MTVQQAIEKAIEGGWNKVQNEKLFPFVRDTWSDPIFWKSLGKALGWGYECFNCGYEISQHIRLDKSLTTSWGNGFPCGGVSNFRSNDYLQHWHRFIDHLIEGGTAESFFAEL